MPSTPRSRIASLALVLSVTACGGSGPARHTTAAEATPPPSTPASSERPPSQPAAASERAPDGRGTANALVIGPVRLELSQPLVVSPEGEARLGHELLGVLGPDGRLTRRGELVAELRSDGSIWVGGEDAGMRVEGTSLDTVDGPMMHIEDGRLLVGGGQVEGERPEIIAIEGYRPELAREVLFLMGVYVAAMSAAYSHG